MYSKLPSVREMVLPSIYFYTPQYDRIVDNMPESADTSWQWQVQDGRYKYDVSDGEYAWIIQTYLRLKEDGFPCQLIGTIPDEGIVLAYRETVPLEIKPGPKLLLVCLQGDKAPLPYAQLSVVQNPRALFTQYTFVGDMHNPKAIRRRSVPFTDKYFIPHWPQAGLIPRDQARGDKFEKVAFFGVGTFLAPEMRAPIWQKQMEDMGLLWHFKGRDQVTDGWTNYSDVDVVLAVRSFDNQDDYSWKPAAKLYNAWHAGVPAILGRDSAFQAERKSELDYIEVTSLDEVFAALKRLRDRADLRQAMAENGRIRAEETEPAKLVAKWRTFLTDTAVPAYERWCKASSLNQQAFFQRRYLTLQANRLRRYVQLKVGGLQRRLSL